jgi:hypothetical protein
MFQYVHISCLPGLFHRLGLVLNYSVLREFSAKNICFSTLNAMFLLLAVCTSYYAVEFRQTSFIGIIDDIINTLNIGF